MLAAPVTIVQNPEEPMASQAVSLLCDDRNREGRQVIQQVVGGQGRHGVDGDKLIVALRDHDVVGATLLRRQPGRTAQIWLPSLAEGEPAETAASLLAAALEVAQQWKSSLVQAVSEPDSNSQLAALLQAGFQHVADLLLLVCWLHDIRPELPELPFELVLYRDTERRRLSSIIESTYTGTLDCPRLNGVREIDDVIDGHQATGAFDPGNWYFVRQRGEDIGCLLLADHNNADHNNADHNNAEHNNADHNNADHNNADHNNADHNNADHNNADHNNTGQWEVVYLGLAPAARGQGYGLQLVQAAQSLARQKGAAQLLLAVDAANAPAIASYLAAGFVEWERRKIFLKVLTPR
jgi:ribosomal protein S18 acetylase RimI-like enzyme